MKKIYLNLFICILVCFLSGCSSQMFIESNVSTECVESQLKNQNLIDSGRYYRIYQEDITNVNYDILNANGEVVLSETTDRPLIIKMINDDIIDISIGMGSGITTHKYYSVRHNLFSETFSYVFATSNELIAYIEIPKEQPLNGRKVVVRNAFDKEEFFKEFQLDFSDVDTPVIQASFSDDDSVLQITYLSGSEQVEISKSISIK